MLAAKPARADSADECVGAAERAQPLKHDGKLRAARDELRVCTRPECPSIVRSDCTRWLAEIDATAPSIVVHATDPSGSDLVDVRVLVDGRLAAASLDGRDIAIDPGPHVLRFEHDGSEPVEEKVVAVLGEQHRRLSVTFRGAAKLAPGPARSERADPSANAGPARSKRADPNGNAGPSRAPAAAPAPAPTLAPLVLAGTGLVAIGAGGFLWSRGLSQCRSNIEPAGPSCSADQSSAARGTLIAGDVLVGAGVAAAAIALALWWIHGRDDSRPLAIAVRTSLLGVSSAF
jgi:hypothetical protein